MTFWLRPSERAASTTEELGSVTSLTPSVSNPLCRCACTYRGGPPQMIMTLNWVCTIREKVHGAFLKED